MVKIFDGWGPGPKKTLFCVLRDELVRVKDELLTEEGRVVIYSLYWQKAKKQTNEQT